MTGRKASREGGKGWRDRTSHFLLFAPEAANAYESGDVLAAMPDIDAKPVILEGYCIRALSLAAGLLLGSGFPAAFAEKIPVGAARPRMASG